MKTDYYSYLLRLWKSMQTESKENWYASLESSETGEKLIFANLKELLEFLKQLTGDPSMPRGNTEE